MTRREANIATITAEDRTALTDSLRRLLADQSGEADVRRTMETPSGYDPGLWKALADMGIAGLVIEESYGGVGAGPVELELVMEETGAALLCAPLLSAVLASGLLQALGDDDGNRRLLPAIAKGAKIATVALAGEQAGGAKRALEITVDYAKTRAQFGRLIGSFQAIKHMAANLMLESESAISAARAAAKALADGAPNANAQISLAAFACADAFSQVTADAIQMHGGIAFTWAHPAHLYLRRARADAQLLGAPAHYRERFLAELGA